MYSYLSHCLSILDRSGRNCAKKLLLTLMVVFIGVIYCNTDHDSFFYILLLMFCSHSLLYCCLSCCFPRSFIMFISLIILAFIVHSCNQKLFEKLMLSIDFCFVLLVQVKYFFVTCYKRGTKALPVPSLAKVVSSTLLILIYYFIIYKLRFHFNHLSLRYKFTVFVIPICLGFILWHMSQISCVTSAYKTEVFTLAFVLVSLKCCDW